MLHTAQPKQDITLIYPKQHITVIHPITGKATKMFAAVKSSAPKMFAVKSSAPTQLPLAPKPKYGWQASKNQIEFLVTTMAEVMEKVMWKCLCQHCSLQDWYHAPGTTT